MSEQRAQAAIAQSVDDMGPSMCEWLQYIRQAYPDGAAAGAAGPALGQDTLIVQD